MKKYICCNCGFRSRFQTTKVVDAGKVYRICNNCDSKVYNSKTVLESILRLDVIKQDAKQTTQRAKEGPLLVGDVVTDNGYWGKIVVTRIVGEKFGGYCISDGKPVDRLVIKEFSRIIGHVDVMVN